MAYARGIDPHRPWMRAPTIAGSFSVLALALACAGEPGVPMNGSDGEPPDVPPWACVPGETQPCPCDDDLEGLMTCDPQGAGFGECDCSPGAVSQGPPPTSTGSESGTASDTGGSADTTAGSTGGSSSGEPDPTTSGSSSGVVDPTTSGGSSSSGSSGTAG